MAPNPVYISTVLILLTTFAIAEDDLRFDDLRFDRDVRPILSENCFHCHGPDDNARQAELRLDTEEGAKELAIEAGDAQASELIMRVTSDDPDMMMPPPDSERSLTADQIEVLRRWIDQGATYEGHWSFVTPQRPSVPEKSNLHWVRSTNLFVRN